MSLFTQLSIPEGANTESAEVTPSFVPGTKGFGAKGQFMIYAKAVGAKTANSAYRYRNGEVINLGTAPANVTCIYNVGDTRYGWFRASGRPVLS